MSKKLAPLLVQTGIMTQKDLDRSLELARKKNMSLLDVILEEKQISEEELADTFARWLKLPRVKLATTVVENEATKAIGEDLAHKHLCLPLKVEGKVLILAMANPADYDAIQDVQFVSGYTVRPVVASRTEIVDGISQVYQTDDRLQDFLENVSETGDFAILPGEKEEVDLDTMESRSAAELPPVVKMCNLIIQDSIKTSASDIHIEPLLNAVQVRLRVDGVLRDYMQVPKWLHNAVVSRLKILAKLDIAERRLPQDGRIKVQLQGRPVDIRVSTLPTHFGEKVVMRILGSSEIPSFKVMGFAPHQVQTIENALAQPQGMVLVTGPTGSGKSTSLYSMVIKRKSAEVNIITVEDPIEYQLAGINQVQVNIKAGLTFAGCLRSILRQDPDVILVGEIRDLETAEIAFQAAMTGHLVLSSLHTNSSLATVARLLDLGVDPFAITSSISVILAQRLARRICLRCKEEYQPSSGLLERLRVDDPNTKFYRGRGCSACGDTGYAGRVGIYEVLRMTPSLKELVHRKAPEPELRKAAGLAGVRFLLEEAMDKVRQGLTTLDEVLRVVQLQEDEITRCPKCSAFINLDFSTCPYCMHALRYLCDACGQELKLEWKLCPYCNTRVNRSAAESEGAPKALPAGSDEAPTAAEAPPAEAAAAAAASGPGDGPPLRARAPIAGVKKPRILVVDDDEGIKKVIQKALGQLPYEVDIRTAADGVEAVEQVAQEAPDLVVLDVMMPRMDGFAVCQKLREDVRTTFIPIMMLTANADEGSRTKGYLVGTDDYLTKPFSVPELNARVMRLLRRTYGI
jgi:type IV pilus assembly protein PilB